MVMASPSSADDPARSRYPSSTIQNLTDEILRDQSASVATPSPDSASLGRAVSSHDYKSHSASDTYALESPLRPRPLTFSPKTQIVSLSTSPTWQDAVAQGVDYHGGALVKSPSGSIASHISKSTMKSRNSVKAPRSMSRSSRPEPYREGRPLDSPMVTTLPTSPERTQSMFSFDEGQQAERDFYSSRRASDRGSDRQQSQYSHHDEPLPPIPADYLIPESPNRGPSNASTIPGSMFRDFDGVHLEEVDEEPEHIPVEHEHEQDQKQDQEHDADQLGMAEEINTEKREHAEKAQYIASSGANEPKSDRLDTAPDASERAPAQSEAEMWFTQARQEAANALEGGTVEDGSVGARPSEILDPAIMSEEDEDEARSELSPLRAAPKEHPQSRQQRRWKEPPPAAGMVYYPAPVPRNLNLPKRLSQVPDLDRDIQAERRSQMISTLSDEKRRSVAWLSTRKSQDNLLSGNDSVQGEEERGRSRRKQPSNMKNLPPQLRASIFFDQPAVEHKVELKRGSAMLTFEDMLDASTKAPVTAFTGITDAYVPQGHGRTTSMMMTDGRPESRQSRGSRLSMMLPEGKSDGRASRASMLSGRRSKSIDRLNQTGNRSSSVLSVSRGVRVLRSEDGLSRLEFEPDDEEHVDEGSRMLEHSPDDDEDIIRVPGQAAHEGEHATEEELEQLVNEEDEEVSGPPTTLLAELQMRKAKLKQRTRTAANAFPNGMHSTLLELEAVAQIEKRKRQNKRTALAWEDPNGGVGQGAAEDVDDDDVPLGMLFPERQGLAAKAGQGDPNRPLGLMEQREFEQNEPLSARRNRLLGIKPAPPQPSPSQPPMEDDTSEHGDETLAQRTRRLQTSKALDDAIGVGGAAHTRAVSDDFASEMMSQFGGLDKAAEPAKPAEPEEETLGQRRKRLQAEASSRGASGQQRQSMANLLATAPIGYRDVSGSTGPSVATSGLLGDAQVRKERERAHILEQNERSGLGIGLGSHLVDVSAARSSNMPQIYQPTAGAAMAARGGSHHPRGWGLPAGSFAHGFGAIPAPHPRGSMLWAAHEDQRARAAGNTFPGQISGQLGMAPTYAAGAQAGPPPDPQTMSPVQRENIDRWRQSIMM